MHTAQENQMEEESLQHNRSEYSLYQDVQFSFTPSFLSHGWEYSLSPVHEYHNTHLDSAGNINVLVKTLAEDTKPLVEKMIEGLKRIQILNVATVITHLFL